MKCLQIHLGMYRVRQKKVAPQSFLPFSQQLFGGLSKFFLQIYILLCSTSKCQVIYDSVEKQRNYGLLKVTTYRFSSIKNVQATTL